MHYRAISGVINYWPVFTFLGFVSVYTFFTVIKANEEFRNHIRAIQWIAEKLSLNTAIEPGEGNKIMFKGYMALPLPLPTIRVVQTFKHLMYGATWGTWFVAVLGLIRKHTPLGWGIALVLAAVIPGLVCLYLHGRVSEAEKTTQGLLEGRQPEGLRIKYPETTVVQAGGRGK